MKSLLHEIRSGRAPLPGVKEIWLLLSVDLQLFLFYFVMFAIEWGAHPEEFSAGYQAVNGPIAFLNTIILLTSGYYVVRMTQAAHAGDSARAHRTLRIALVLGVAFIVFKFVGYAADISAGHFEFDNAFFGYYLLITVSHLFHVGIGVVVFVACSVRLDDWIKTERGNDYIDTCAIFWHFVDMVWVLLFPICYLMG